MCHPDGNIQKAFGICIGTTVEVNDIGGKHYYNVETEVQDQNLRHSE